MKSCKQIEEQILLGNHTKHLKHINNCKNCHNFFISNKKLTEFHPATLNVPEHLSFETIIDSQNDVSVIHFPLSFSSAIAAVLVICLLTVPALHFHNNYLIQQKNSIAQLNTHITQEIEHLNTDITSLEETLILSDDTIQNDFEEINLALNNFYI